MREGGVRDRFLRALVVFGAALALITEALGAVSMIRARELALCWVIVLAIGLAAAKKQQWRFTARFPSADPVVLLCSGGILVILTVTAVTAAFSPPNSTDAMAYHMPRVVYWAEAASVRFFPTPYFNQIMLQPLAEYAMLHTYVLSGGDHLVNFVQWFGSLTSIITVSSVARMFGASARGQAIAALFCATLPSGILASSGAKNDYWMAMWLIAAVYFALCFTESLRIADALCLGAAFGLALLTKATAYLFVPWPLAAIFVARAGKFRLRQAGGLPHEVLGAVVAMAMGFALNAPQYLRNYSFSGSILGFDSAQGDGFYRWRNETFGWKETASNMVRNLSEQLGGRSDAWNRGVYALALDAHRVIGIEVNDARTTFRGSAFAPPKNANHEADAPNRWHLAMIVAFSLFVILRRGRGGREQLLYVVALICAFVAFCAYLKWQPFMSRLLLPLFVLSAPLAAVLGEIGGTFVRPIWRSIAQVAVCLFLLSVARLPLLENWVRPLRGQPNSVLHTPRSVQYFADMNYWNEQAAYRRAADLLASSNCDTIGIDITDLQLEYPLQALIREKKAEARFIHTGVQNVSSRYRQPVDAPPCAVVCLDCAGDEKRLKLYDDFPARALAGKCVVLGRRASRAE